MRDLYEELSGGYDSLRNVKLSDDISVYAGEGDYTAIQMKKAALMLHSLRGELGEEAFAEFIRAYYRDNYLAMTNREHLIHAAEEAHGQSLAEFFGMWLDGSELPEMSWNPLLHPVV